MNDLLTVKELGQQRSRMTRLIIITGRRFHASKNQIQLVILEFGDLGHKTGSFSNWCFSNWCDADADSSTSTPTCGGG